MGRCAYRNLRAATLRDCPATLMSTRRDRPEPAPRAPCLPLASEGRVVVADTLGTSRSQRAWSSWSRFAGRAAAWPRLAGFACRPLAGDARPRRRPALGRCPAAGQRGRGWSSCARYLVVANRPCRPPNCGKISARRSAQGPVRTSRSSRTPKPPSMTPLLPAASSSSPACGGRATSYARPVTGEEATAQARQRLSLILAGLAGIGVPSAALSEVPAAAGHGESRSPAISSTKSSRPPRPARQASAI